MPPSELPEDFESRWRERFERFGRTYSTEAQIAGWSANGLMTRLRAFERRCGSVSGCWLDAGCGAGSYVRVLRSRGAERVCGLDYSLPSLAKARQTGAHDPGVTWLAADVRRLPFAAGRFDGVLCFGVTQALSDSAALVQELVRVTRPGGEVWLDGLNGHCLPDLARRFADHLMRRPNRLRFESARRLRQVLIEAGCREVNIGWVPVMPERLAGLQARVERIAQAPMPIAASVMSHAFLLHARR